MMEEREREREKEKERERERERKRERVDNNIVFYPINTSLTNCQLSYL